MKLTILVSDLQIPYHHRKACAALCDMLSDRANDISEVFQVGDFYDFEAISHWVSGTRAEDGRAFQRELDSATELLTQFQECWPWEKIRIRGNHDDRLDKYLGNTAKGLHGLRALDYDTITDAAAWGWTTVEQPYKLAHNTVSVHGLSVRSKSGYTPHAHLDRIDGNVIHGHTHRAGLVYRTTGDRTRFGMEIGCLMDRKRASYLGPGSFADWQLAFGALWVDGDLVQPELIYVRPNGEFIFDGRRYRP